MSVTTTSTPDRMIDQVSEIQTSRRPLIKRTQSDSPPRKKGKIIATRTDCGDKRSQSLSLVKGHVRKVTPPPSTPSHKKSSDSVYSKENSYSYAVERRQSLVPLSQNMLVKTINSLGTKKREFMVKRKHFIAQQKEIIQQYSALRELEERAGIKESTLGEMRVVSVDTWRAHELLLLLVDDHDAPNFTDLEGDFGPRVLHKLYTLVDSIRSDLLSVCLELMTSREKIIDLFKSDRGSFVKSDWKSKKLKINEETEYLQALLHKATNNIEKRITKVLQIAKTPWIDREQWFQKLEAVNRDNFMLNEKIEENSRPDFQNEMECSTDLRLKTEQLNEDLTKERAARDVLKEGLATAENMLRVARTRIAELKRQLKESHVELETARRKYKDQELLHRHRQLHLDANSKKLREVSKSGEAAFEALVQQRNALELRVKELRDEVQHAEDNLGMKLSEVRAKADSLQAKLIDQEKMKAAAESKAKQYEMKVMQIEKTMHDMREYSMKLVSMNKKHCLEYVPNKEPIPSAQDVEIWRELSLTRSVLLRTEEELRESRADKENLLNTLNKIAQEQGDAKRDMLSTELLNRETKILRMQKVIEDNKLNEKIMQQKQAGHERELSALRLEVAKLRNYEYFSKTMPYQDLHIMLMELHMQIEILTKERTELVSAATSRALMLERHERATSLFCCMTRARRDLAAIVDGCEEPFRVDETQAELSRSVSCVCGAASETWTALNAERVRVMELENAVKAQNLLLQREAGVRVHLEQIRSALEKNNYQHQFTAQTSSCRGPVP